MCMDSLEMRTGERILPLRGETMVVRCFFDSKHEVEVPAYLFNPLQKSFWYPLGEIKKKFHNKEIENHAFVSPCGSIYCGRECWSRYCED